MLLINCREFRLGTIEQRVYKLHTKVVCNRLPGRFEFRTERYHRQPACVSSAPVARALFLAMGGIFPDDAPEHHEWGLPLWPFAIGSMLVVIFILARLYAKFVVLCINFSPIMTMSIHILGSVVYISAFLSLAVTLEDDAPLYASGQLARSSLVLGAILLVRTTP